jgi:predicted  nucleic acid-binding Zn-ribbon protein
MSEILLAFGIIATISANIINALLNNKTGAELKDQLNRIEVNQTSLKSEVAALKTSDETNRRRFSDIDDELKDIRKTLREVAL